MTNEEKMLNLVLSEEILTKNYEIELEEPLNMEDALHSENPMIVAVAKVIRELRGQNDRSIQKEVYNEVRNYLNQKL